MEKDREKKDFFLHPLVIKPTSAPTKCPPLHPCIQEGEGPFFVSTFLGEKDGFLPPSPFSPCRYMIRALPSSLRGDQVPKEKRREEENLPIFFRLHVDTAFAEIQLVPLKTIL